jgi:hypothetical protein
MSPQSVQRETIASLAKELVQLAAVVRDVDALARGPHRVRAALAVLRTHVALGAALGPEHAAAWALRGRMPLERALAAVGGESNEAFDVRPALLDAPPFSERRTELLVRGLHLRGRKAILHRVQVELATDPESAHALAVRAPQPWTAEATRLAQTGILRFGRSDVFVAPANDDAALRFPPSVALARACAQAGAYDAYLRVKAALGLREPTLDVIAAFAAGDDRMALGRLARLSACARDRAHAALVSLAIQRTGTLRAEWLARKIKSSKLRAAAFGAIVHADAIALRVRRELEKEIRNVQPLEHALLSAEVALVRQSQHALFQSLDRAGRLLCQTTPLALLGDGSPTSWERALRCTLALLFSDQTPPRSLRFSRATLLALAHSAFVRREIAPLVPLCPPKLEPLVERVPERYQRFASMLRGLSIEQRVRRLRAPERVRELTRATRDQLLCPTCRDEAIVAGALLKSDAVEVPSEATCALRAAFDFGVALSPRGPSQRRVLLNAAKASLRAVRVARASEIVRLRVATLRQLESSCVADLAGQLLVECELPKAVRLELLELVVRQRASSAARFVWSHFGTLTDGGRDADDVLACVERMRVVEPRTAKAWERLRGACGGLDACDFWTSFLAVWQATFHRSGSRRLLAVCSASLQAGELPCDGRLAAEIIVRGIRRWGRKGLRGLFERGTERDREWAVLACEPDSNRSWSVERWEKILGQIDGTGSVDAVIVARFASKLPKAPLLGARELLSGCAPTPDLQKPVDLEHGLELVYLDKSRELLSFLRLADCVGCCFSSDSPHYEGEMKTSQWILRLFRDPLSYGFHVRRVADGARVGFVFGGFGLLGGDPALLLNGIYLRRQEPAVRARVLNAIEGAFARPLGIPLLGVANRYAGAGELPPDYRFETRRGTRLRALRDERGAPQRTVYDDISERVNEETDLSLHFKSTLPAADVCS